MGEAMGHWSWNRPAFLAKGMIPAGTWGPEEPVAEGGHPVGGGDER